MLAPAALPGEYEQWNRQWGSPHGRPLPGLFRRVPLPERLRIRARGPFGFQPNTETRRFEYPWAFHSTRPAEGLKVVEVGGGLSGLQFAMASSGAHVVNVDPFVDYGTPGEYRDLPAADRHRQLARAFAVDVELEACTLEEAGLPPDQTDVVVSISTLEHLSRPELSSLLSQVRRILRPGGRVVLTVDLFLDLLPFTSKTANRWGTNLDIRALVELSGLELVSGHRRELYGFAEFDPDDIQSRLAEFMMGTYPGLAQCLVLEKRGET